MIIRSKLYQELTQTFRVTILWGKEHEYILPVFGRYFKIIETPSDFKLVYKDQLIQSYPNTHESIKSINTILHDCVFNECGSGSNKQMCIYEKLSSGRYHYKIVWNVSGPFSSGALTIDKYDGENEYLPGPLTAQEVAEEIFRRFPHLPFICFRINQTSFIYINRNHL